MMNVWAIETKEREEIEGLAKEEMLEELVAAYETIEDLKEYAMQLEWELRNLEEDMALAFPDGIL